MMDYGAFDKKFRKDSTPLRDGKKSIQLHWGQLYQIPSFAHIGWTGAVFLIRIRKQK
jgi:hypothetical protein